MQGGTKQGYRSPRDVSLKMPSRKGKSKKFHKIRSIGISYLVFLIEYSKRFHFTYYFIARVCHFLFLLAQEKKLTKEKKSDGGHSHNPEYPIDEVTKPLRRFELYQDAVLCRKYSNEVKSASF